MACFGPQPTTHNASQSKNQKPFSPNVDAADSQEDIAPNGTQAYGQSEESVAAIGRYVVEAWNDSTGFFAPPCSPMFKDQLTGLGTAITDVYTTIDTSPTTTSTPSNVKVTTGPSDWNAVSSDIIPNFGDYTDNYVIATQRAPYTQQTLYIAWADGRLGEPQPFNAHTN